MIQTGGEFDRGNLDRVLSTWFRIDRAVVLDPDGYPFALPRAAATASAYWVQRTAHAQTMGQWRKVHQAWLSLCPQGLLLGPEIWDLDDPDEFGDPDEHLPDDAPFSVFEGLYDVSELGYTIQSQLAQDAWIPDEWAEELGEPDRGYGLDYEPADRLYQSSQRLVAKLGEVGIETVTAPDVVRAVWDPDPIPPSHDVNNWTPSVVDEFGNPI